MGGRAPQEGADSGPPVERGTDHVVLAVDGDPTVGAWLARVLGDAGLVATTVGDGRTALRLVADGRIRPDVLLTELDLPGIGGVELAARITAFRPDARVVMMTADPVRAAVARGHPSIVATVLLKPLRDEEVVAAVRRPDAPAVVG